MPRYFIAFPMKELRSAAPVIRSVNRQPNASSRSHSPMAQTPDLRPYMPIILEACREAQYSYEYRDGAASYGAFTFALARSLRDTRALGRDPSFVDLTRLAAEKLKALRYNQDPCLVGPKSQIRAAIPWRASPTAARNDGTKAKRRQPIRTGGD